jgi:hypothetical protein
MSQVWRVATSISCREFPTRAHIVRGLMLLSCRACFGGMQTRSSLQMGTISTEYVNLKLAVLECVSEEMICSEDLELSLFLSSSSVGEEA